MLDEESLKTSVQNVIRLALATQNTGKPLKRTDITSMALPQNSSRACYNKVIAETRNVLNESFGLQLTLLPVKTASYTLTSTLSATDRKKLLLSSPSQAKDWTFLAICLTIVTLNGMRVKMVDLRHYFQSKLGFINVEQDVIVSKELGDFEVKLKQLESQKLINYVTGAEEGVIWIEWGYKARILFPPERVIKFIEYILGGVAMRKDIKAMLLKNLQYQK